MAHGAIFGVKRCTERYGWCRVRLRRGVETRRIRAHDSRSERNPSNTSEKDQAREGSGHFAVASSFGSEDRRRETKDEHESGDVEHGLRACRDLTQIEPERERPARLGVQPWGQYTDDSDDGEYEDAEARFDRRVAANFTDRAQSEGGVTRNAGKMRSESALVDPREGNHRREEGYLDQQKLTV